MSDHKDKGMDKLNNFFQITTKNIRLFRFGDKKGGFFIF